MPFLGFEQVAATAVVKDIADLTVPSRCDRVMIQADTQNVRYIMIPPANRPPTSALAQGVGMVFVVGLAPEEFLVEDLKNIQFTRGAGSDGNLNIHYYAGRNIT